MRLQVFLSHSGVCSRRKALEIILANRVSVNGKMVSEPSFDVDNTKDKVFLDGKPVFLSEKIYILLNKPTGVVSTKSDPHAEKTVIDLLPEKLKNVFPVGRLDKDTTGLLLLTNDGDLAHRLLHPSFETDKTYRVIINKPLIQADKDKLEKGVVLEEKKTAPSKIKSLGGCGYEIVLHEGRKRQIRKMFSLFHYHVEELCRIRQGSLTLGNLKLGEWRFLSTQEIELLHRPACRQAGS